MIISRSWLADTIWDLLEDARQLPSSRENSLTITKLQEAYFWARADYDENGDQSDA